MDSRLNREAIPETTEALVIQTAKQGVVAPQQLMAMMTADTRETVKFYFDGKIRQWYSCCVGKGVIFPVDTKTEKEARAVMETLPLAKEQLMDHVYIPVGPLMRAEGFDGPRLTCRGRCSPRLTHSISEKGQVVKQNPGLGRTRPGRPTIQFKFTL